jgi:hypothetical protein
METGFIKPEERVGTSRKYARHLPFLDVSSLKDQHRHARARKILSGKTNRLLILAFAH